MKKTGCRSSSDAENMAWFVLVAPYTEMALPSKIIDANALAMFVRLYEHNQSEDNDGLE